MKKRFLIITSVFILLANISVFAQSSTPEQAAKTFYTWYVKDGGPYTPKLKKYVTLKFYNKVLKLQKNADGDYYTHEGGGAAIKSFAKAETISAGKTNAKVKVTLIADSSGEEFDQILIVTMVKEGSVWKISNVEDE